MGKYSKKIISFVLVVMMSVTMLIPVFADGEISVYLDNEKIQFDVAPILVNGRTMVPMRMIFEKLGATVSWDDDTRTAIAQKGNINVSIAIDDTTLFKNGSAITLDVPAQLNSGRTLVPLRAVSEAFECDVQWDSTTRTIKIENKNYLIDGNTQYSSSYLSLVDSIIKNGNKSNDEYVIDISYSNMLTNGNSTVKFIYDVNNKEIRIQVTRMVSSATSTVVLFLPEKSDETECDFSIVVKNNTQVLASGKGIVEPRNRNSVTITNLEKGEKYKDSILQIVMQDIENLSSGVCNMIMQNEYNINLSGFGFKSK